MITHLPPVREVIEPEPFAGPDHPMRRLTRDIAFGLATWDDDRAQSVAEIFDGLAATWTADRDAPTHVVPLADAIDRGGAAGGRCVELGSGTGLATPLLVERYGSAISVDLSLEMLRGSPGTLAPRVRADSAHLPLPDAAVDVLVLVNMLLFPDEVDRVLAPSGSLVWVNSIGDQTPIHLPAEQVAAALPGSWQGQASHAGTGTWAVLRRS